MTELRVEDEERETEVPTRLGIAALAQDVAVYGATRVLLKSLAFLLVPLYAHFLAPEQFGILELVLATVAFVDVLLTANMDGVLARFYFDRDDRQWRRQVITLYLAIETVYPAVVVGGLLAFSTTLSEKVTGSVAFASFFVIALVDLYLTNIVDLPMLLCRLRRKPMTFAFYSAVRGLTQIGFSVVLVAVWHLGVKGILIASLVSVCVAFVLTVREYAGDITRRVDWRVGWEMVSFAAPGIVGGLAFYALNLINRFFINHYHGTADTGLFGVAFRYSQVVLVGVYAFRMGWTQWHYSWLNTGRHPEMVARGANYYYFGAGFLAVVTAAWILPVFHLIMPPDYWDATAAVAPLALAAVATGAYSLYTVGLAVTKRMRMIPILSAVGAAIAVGLYFLLIPPYSFQGAAWATAAAMTVLAIIVHAVSDRIYPVPWDWRRIALAAGLTTSLCLATLAVDAWMGVALSLPVRLGLTLAYPLVLFWAGFFPPGDLAAVRSRLPQPRSRPSSS